MTNLERVISIIQNAKGTLFILCGFPYAGKSYVAAELQRYTDIHIVAIDDIFKTRGFDWDTNILPSADEWEQIFSESYEKVKEALVSGKTVLYDSTNQTLVSRQMLQAVAKSVGADTTVLYIQTPVITVWQRWEENQLHPQRSVIGRELVQQTIAMFEEPTAAEQVLVIDN